MPSRLSFQYSVIDRRSTSIFSVCPIEIEIAIEIETDNRLRERVKKSIMISIPISKEAFFP